MFDWRTLNDNGQNVDVLQDIRGIIISKNSSSNILAELFTHVVLPSECAVVVVLAIREYLIKCHS